MRSRTAIGSRFFVLLAMMLAIALGSQAKAESTAQGAGPWALPPADSCEPQGGLRSWPVVEDAGEVAFKIGDSFSLDQLELLRNFLPAALWENREKFFYEGMQLVIGGCFANYAVPGFYTEATEKFKGQARLGEGGELVNYTAGLPFAPSEIAQTDADAGLKWAWNFEHRYQGAGFRGDFRTSDMVGRTGRAEPFIGEIFKFQFAFRSDRADDDYTAPGAKNKHWVSGGMMKEPFDARHYSWRQYRDTEHMESADRSDDIHAYNPGMRRVRRVVGAGVEGLYMPAFNIGAVKSTVLAVGGTGGAAAGAGSISGGGGMIKTKRSGFEGLELRPLLYHIKLLGIHDVLTPINSTVAGYPEDSERDFGPWGLSFASDTWDLRRAIVFEGRTKDQVGGDQVSRMILYIDLQTLSPLYYQSWDSRDEVVDVGMFVGRWSETQDDYPRWPDDDAREIRVIDSVGASFANLQEGGGWRRESWTILSTPLTDRQIKRQTSVSNLTKRH
ncbi:MAG: DUF1329 domain-containing protein [Myxococcota bacterium]